MYSESNTTGSTSINRRPLLKDYDPLSFGIVTWASLDPDMYGPKMYLSGFYEKPKENKRPRGRPRKYNPPEGMILEPGYYN